MAKIKYYKIKGKLPKTTRIESIVGKAYLDNYKNMMNECRKNSMERQKTLLKAEKIGIIGNDNSDNHSYEEKISQLVKKKVK